MLRKVIFAIIVILLIAMVAVPAFASIFWTYEETSRSVDITSQFYCPPPGDCYETNKFSVKGANDWIDKDDLGVGTQIFDQSFSCTGETHVVVWKKMPSLDPRVRVFCITNPLPTPAPTDVPCAPWETCP
jgi:hypothetical protein